MFEELSRAELLNAVQALDKEVRRLRDLAKANAKEIRHLKEMLEFWNSQL